MKTVKNNELCSTVTLQDTFSVNKFHEPFKYPEWRRELIYSIRPRTKKKYCQSYYYYNNTKLGTNKQIAEKLKEFDETLKTNGRSVSGLTLENFSLKHLPIGINDSNKELIKDLTQKVSKNLKRSEKHGKPNLLESSNLSSYSGEKPSSTTMETNSDTIQVDEPETSVLNYKYLYQNVNYEHFSAVTQEHYANLEKRLEDTVKSPLVTAFTSKSTQSSFDLKDINEKTILLQNAKPPEVKTKLLPKETQSKDNTTSTALQKILVDASVINCTKDLPSTENHVIEIIIPKNYSNEQKITTGSPATDGKENKNKNNEKKNIFLSKDNFNKPENISASKDVIEKIKHNESSLEKNMQVEPSSNLKKHKREDKKSNSNKKIKLNLNVEDPKYKEPFKYSQWSRELVNGNCEKNTNKPNIYYHLKYFFEDDIIKYKFSNLTEIAEKLPEFEKYLISQGKSPSGLTVDNFTFIKAPLGLEDPKKEKTRQARKRIIKKNELEKDKLDIEVSTLALSKASSSANSSDFDFMPESLPTNNHSNTLPFEVGKVTSITREEFSSEFSETRCSTPIPIYSNQSTVNSSNILTINLSDDESTPNESNDNESVTVDLTQKLEGIINKYKVDLQNLETKNKDLEQQNSNYAELLKKKQKEIDLLKNELKTEKIYHQKLLEEAKDLRKKDDKLRNFINSLTQNNGKN